MLGFQSFAGWSTELYRYKPQVDRHRDSNILTKIAYEKTYIIKAIVYFVIHSFINSTNIY